MSDNNGENTAAGKEGEQSYGDGGWLGVEMMVPSTQQSM